MLMNMSNVSAPLDHATETIDLITMSSTQPNDTLMTWVNNDTKGQGQLESSYTIQSILAIQLLRLGLGGAAVCSNALLVATVARWDILQSPGNIIAASLGVADLCHGFSRLLVMVTDEPVKIPCPVLCYLQVSLGLLGIFGNIFFILAMTVHRYIAIQYPLRYNDLVTTARTVKVLGLVWSVILTITVTLMAVTMNNEQLNRKLLRCYGFGYITLPLNSSIMLSLYTVGLLITMFLYVKIILVARQQARRIHAVEQVVGVGVSKVLGKAPLTVSKVVLLYLLTTLPIMILNQVAPYTGEYLGRSWLGVLRYVFSVLWLANSYLNPVIYAFSDSLFREKMRATLRCPT